ncbi:ras suppressor protein 1 [Plakobranchus ocellatus]|uniref:Ras suppressor protein 1 n=1 Tax=Plakobranchus ocellatus TaxID=259542 RepID=A0AAV3Y9P0_9GAST|nr:ras suppressor protein 1 [Plakobranchus ocellatus]
MYQQVTTVALTYESRVLWSLSSPLSDSLYLRANTRKVGIMAERNFSEFYRTFLGGIKVDPVTSVLDWRKPKRLRPPCMAQAICTIRPLFYQRSC